MGEKHNHNINGNPTKRDSWVDKLRSTEGHCSSSSNGGCSSSSNGGCSSSSNGGCSSFGVS
ncbi:hypothetical protein J6590_070653 [Homalodisca vitripennis]|nr:hypothetical protein J6590_070653 [Homalodisca vitripennis]